ncbi:hypothetical protein HPB49_025576 [Dermacentor silvarum]|uniref:Uncharacterized protein n=1 Tax=Dermacentor silvarum TaxID=543639 RepID=A0ACB8CCD7_DERSI|nr:hypothetical protein HPB49_025576 [Dermacentor silvarum]
MAAASSFAALDYAVLTGFLALSASIGAFFAWRDRRDKSNRQFLTANKQLGWLPVSVSMVASFVSATSILGLPSQVFVRGLTLWMNAVSSTLAMLVVAFVFLPMYYKMDITSINEDCVDPQYICPFIRPCMGNYARGSKDADNALMEQLPTNGTASTELRELTLGWQQPTEPQCLA